MSCVVAGEPAVRTRLASRAPSVVLGTTPASFAYFSRARLAPTSLPFHLLDMPPFHKRQNAGGGSSSQDAQQKKPRPPADDDDDDMDLDEMLAEEDDIDNEQHNMGPLPDEEDANPVQLLGQKDMETLEKQWKRPPLPDPLPDTLTFQQFEADYTVNPIPPVYAQGSSEPKAATVRLFGVTRGGNSVVAHVHGFRPYFYVRAPAGFQQQDVLPFQNALAAKLKQSVPQKDQNSACVLNCAAVSKQSIMHYNFGSMQPFIRIIVALPSFVATARRLLEQGLNVPRHGVCHFDTFESNCAYALRYMVDRDIVGCSWVELPPGKWKPRSSTGGGDKPCTHCQLEVDCWFSDLIAHPPEGEHMDIAPMRILSFDIECAGRPGIFPEAEKDEIIQIANHVITQGENKTVVKNIFTLKSCSPISGAQVRSSPPPSSHPPHHSPPRHTTTTRPISARRCAPPHHHPTTSAASATTHHLHLASHPPTTTSHTVRLQVLSFETEEEMLRSWHQFLIACDCDIITGERHGLRTRRQVALLGPRCSSFCVRAPILTSLRIQHRQLRLTVFTQPRGDAQN